MADLEIRFDVEIRWSRERGWLEIRDAFTGEWHEVRADQAPPWWRQWATVHNPRRRGGGKRAAA